MTLRDELKAFDTANFRELYHRFLYLDCKKLLEEIFPEELADDITGVFAYGYIDATEGISFRPFLLAKMTETSIQVFDMPHCNDTIYILRVREAVTKMSELHDGDNHMYLYALNPNELQFLNLEVLNVPLDDFSGLKENVDENYKVDEDREDLRGVDYSFLDQFRNSMYPDDVAVLLFSEDKGIEQVWVRTMFATDKEIFGELLNEPYQDYGCHEGNIIGFGVAGNGEEKILVFTGHIAEK